MKNEAFRYLPEENLATAQQLEHLKQIFVLPIDDAELLTDDELCEDMTEGLDA